MYARALILIYAENKWCLRLKQKRIPFKNSLVFTIHKMLTHQKKNPVNWLTIESPIEIGISVLNGASDGMS